MSYDAYQPQMAPPPKSRSGRWLILAGCGGAIAIAACVLLFVGGILMIVFGAIRNSEVYTTALEIAQDSDEVQDELGEPVEAGWFVSGSIETSGASGQADISIPISGPDGSGDLRVSAERRGGRWQFYYLTVEVDGGPEIDLLGGR